MLFDFINVSRGEDQVPKKANLKLLYSKELKGPISAVSSIKGYLIIAIGPKIIVYTFEHGNELIGTAFFDAQIYVVSINCVKNFILLGDMYKSIYFLRWKEEGKSLTLLAKDYNHLNVCTTEFLVNHQDLTLIVADEDKNVQLFTFSPTKSRGGQMLLAKADFHVGANITKFLRFRLLSNKPDQNPNQSQQAVLFGTLDGGIGYFVPMEEHIYRKLSALYHTMIVSIPHVAGLNPKSFRLLQAKKKPLHGSKRNIIDGELVWKFLSLDRPKQKELAAQIQTTPLQIINYLVQIDRSTTFF